MHVCAGSFAASMRADAKLRADMAKAASDKILEEEMAKDALYRQRTMIVSG